MLNEWRAAILRHTPPTPELMEAGRTVLGPAAATAAGVFALTLLVFGKRAALAGAALAMLAGVEVANYYRNVFPWWPTPNDEGHIIGWHWLPVLFLLALFDGLFARTPGVPLWGGWRLRIGIAALAALILVPFNMYKTWPVEVEQWPYLFRARIWPQLAFALAVTLGWAGSEAAAKQAPGGMIGLGLGLALLGAGFVVVHAHTARMADALSMVGAALVGISIVALFCKVDLGGAIPGVALMLPSLLLVAGTESYSEVPWYAFVLAACPPILVGLLAIPPVSRASGFWKGVLFWVLCLGPTVAAVTLAVWKEGLPGDAW